MDSPAHFEINLALHRRGDEPRHVFATHPKSATTKRKAKVLFDVISKAFPAREGWVVSVLRIDEAFGDTVATDVTEYFRNLDLREDDNNGFLTTTTGVI